MDPPQWLVSFWCLSKLEAERQLGYSTTQPSPSPQTQVERCPDPVQPRTNKQKKRGERPRTLFCSCCAKGLLGLLGKKLGVVGLQSGAILVNPQTITYN